MKLRCIHCARQSDKVILSGAFECIDKVECATYAARHYGPVQQVAIFSDAACDGGNKREGQLMGVGIHTKLNGAVMPEWCGCTALPHGSINDGEWLGVIYALKVALHIRKNGPHSRYTFRLFSDSFTVVNGFNGVCKMAAKFRPYDAKAKHLVSKLGASFLGLTYVPREHNKEADILSKLGLTKHKNI